ncbi:Lrp/AsnC family transcriptional regulator [Parenemella sanctibonifatiensis]|uniref:AsnC family transcriptional regulator n=1 Tax=Parenemella sanctibonifatiensis TaxID=2016505 RepID=A0A255EES4_9ACTN|nr:Lrp/AsnC ligand binding domain-containing protein [Parenemella sanctibonifatiensis]OYN90047.1 AsnC family transcriptional regulator [Parenemella sanctibonifatiensis]OYN91268.1 AsnC family transcriptional regulator [Parenemella sanctibonifatiensis]
MSVHSYVLVQCAVGQAAAVAETVRALPGVIKAETVTGPYDVIVEVEAGTIDELGRLIIGQLQQVPGITNNVTCPVVRL